MLSTDELTYILFRERRISRSCWIQLLFRHVATREATQRHPSEQVPIRHAQSETGHHGHLARSGMDGIMESFQLRQLFTATEAQTIMKHSAAREPDYSTER